MTATPTVTTSDDKGKDVKSSEPSASDPKSNEDAIGDSEDEDEAHGDSLDPPDVDVRWVHGGAQFLDLLSTPITALNDTYEPFSDVENEKLEERWSRMSGPQRQQAIKNSGKESEKEKEQVESLKKQEQEQKEEQQQGQEDEQATKEDKIAGSAKTSVAESPQQSPETYYPDPEDHPSGTDGVISEEPESADPNRGGFPFHHLHDHRSKLSVGSQTPPPGVGSPRSPTPTTRRPISLIRRESILEQTSDEDLDIVKGVSVSQDGLFEVSIENMTLSPVFWAQTGPRVPVIRATWFIDDEKHPCSWELAEVLENGYREIKPWLSSYSQELQKAIEQGSTAEEKLKIKLDPKFNVGQYVVYENATCGQLVQSGVSSYLSKIFWSSLRSKPGGTMVYRGYEAALKASGHGSKNNSRRSSRNDARRPSVNLGNEKKPRSSSISQENRSAPDSKLKESVAMDRKSQSSDLPARQPSEKSTVTATATTTTGSNGETAKHKLQKLAQGKIDEITHKISQAKSMQANALKEQQVPISKDHDDRPCTDLVLVVHGIGQLLATQYEGFNFVYATNMLRSNWKTQAQNPAISSIIRDRRVQALPIQWRASLKIEHKNDEEDAAHGMDNRFSIADITLTKIPMIRSLTNQVLLDIPLFMSAHRQSMIEAVCTQANRAYRMWCARNPGFDKNGRVHIIAHSLGSALAAHILSDQPTRMPPLSEIPKSIRSQTNRQFLFNTSNLFLCGSPLGIFLHLDQAQIMPRKGRERTMDSPPDEAIDRAGRFGCMAIDSLYNIVHLSDPIAYTLNAAVDVKIAKERPPMPIASVTAPFYANLPDSIRDLGKYFEGLSLPSLPGRRGHQKGASSSDSSSSKPVMIRLPSGLEMTGPEGRERLNGTPGERRLSALNPHGSLDFSLPGNSIVSDYLDALTSHAGYWSSPEFGAFLLTEIYSTKMDFLRTGMGLQQATATP